MIDPQIDRGRLLACRTEEEWQWWIEGIMIKGDHDICLFCRSYLDDIGRDCALCLGETEEVYGELLNGCYRRWKFNSKRYFAGWDRLRRSGIV